MKKAISAIITATLCFSTAVPFHAQRNREISPVGVVRSQQIFSSTNAFSEGRGVWIEWRTMNETGIAGFRVYRLEDGLKQSVSPGMIAGASLSAGENAEAGKGYSFFDARGDLDTVYLVEALAFDGSVISSGKFAARYVENFEQVTGYSSELLMRHVGKNSNPSVRKENLELPPDIEAEINARSSAALLFDTSAVQKWVAAQPGAKIAVRQDGFYRVTREQLQEAGFDVDAPTENWQLYADGVEQAISIGPNGDYIEFFGRGVDLTETDTRMYYLIVGSQAGKRIETGILRRLSASVESANFRQTMRHKDHFVYVNSILNGDATNYMGTLITTGGGITIFTLNGVDFNAPTATIEINVQGFTSTLHQIRVNLNNVDLGFINGSHHDLMSGTYEIPTSVLHEGMNVLRLYSATTQSNSFMESLKVTYNRKYSAVQNRLSFYTNNYRTTRVEGFDSSAVRVLDLTDEINPRFITNAAVEPSGDAFDLVLPSSRGRVLYAFSDSGILSPEAVTTNTPSTLSSPENEGELIIISYKDWLSGAEAWADYRRNDGMTVKVVDVEDVFDEFGYGLATAESIRSFLNYAKNNWQTPPDHVFLIGDATYDPRNFSGTGNFNHVPAKIVDTSYIETGSDEALADFDNDGLAELSIGRIPVRSAEEVTALLAKVTAFEQTLAQAPARGALCFSDLPNGYDFEGICSRLWQMLPDEIPRILLNRSAPDAREQVLNAINNGIYLLNYAGHGATTFWDGNILHRDDVPGMTNDNNHLVIANMLTCLNGYYIERLQDGLSEAMIKKETGGAIASWASSGLTTPDIQEIMAARFYQQLATGSMTRMGDLVRDAKTMIPGGRDVRLSWVLLGDPTLKIKPQTSPKGSRLLR